MGRMMAALLAGAMLTEVAGVTAPGVAAQGVAVATQQAVDGIGRRVGTLESQMRAVQRQVFPGGDKRFFQPEVAPATETPVAPATPTGAAATAPIADLTQRVEALERQQRTLTGQLEELQFKTRQLETAQAKFRADAEFRLDALEGKSAPPASPTTVPAMPAAAVAPSPKPVVPVASPAKPAPAPGTPEATEAAYRAAFARWTAKDYAVAATQLQAFVAANPKAARASHAQFWAGRALLEQGQTAQAAKAFLAGYQTYPRGERAPNSLLWLGKALTGMKQPKAACQALDQLGSAYPDKLTGQLKTDADAARAQAKCQ